MDLSQVRQAFETFAAQSERELQERDNRNTVLQANVSEARAATEEAQREAQAERAAKDEAVTALSEAEASLIAAQKTAGGRIAELEATNAMLIKRDKESRDEHTRLRAIITKKNTERK